MVQVLANGTLDKVVYGAVPRTLPQTSLAAEYAALAAAVANSRGVNYVGVCVDVISSTNGSIDAALTSRSPHACTWRVLLHRYGDTLQDRVVSASKVKAHRHLCNVDDSPGEVRKFWGNHYADVYARLGAELHAPLPDDVRNYKKNRSDLVKLAYHMVDVLSTLRLSRVESQGRVHRLPVSARPIGFGEAPKETHDFRWFGKCWVCTKCLFRTVRPTSVSSTRKVCKGESHLATLLSTNRGHRLWTANVQGGGVVVYCSKCWGYA